MPLLQRQRRRCAAPVRAVARGAAAPAACTVSRRSLVRLGVLSAIVLCGGGGGGGGGTAGLGVLETPAAAAVELPGAQTDRGAGVDDAQEQTRLRVRKALASGFIAGKEDHTLTHTHARTHTHTRTQRDRAETSE